MRFFFSPSLAFSSIPFNLHFILSLSLLTGMLFFLSFHFFRLPSLFRSASPLLAFHLSSNPLFFAHPSSALSLTAFFPPILAPFPFPILAIPIFSPLPSPSFSVSPRLRLFSGRTFFALSPLPLFLFPFPATPTLISQNPSAFPTPLPKISTYLFIMY